MNTIVDLIIFFGGALYLLMGISQFLKRRLSARDILMAIILLSVAVIQLQLYYSIVFDKNYFAVGKQPVQFAKFLLGPVFFIYYCIYFRHDKSFRAIYAVHFIPALGSIILQVIANGICPSSFFSSPILCNAFQKYNILIVYNWIGFILLLLYFLYLFYILGIYGLIFQGKQRSYSVVTALIITVVIMVLLLMGMAVLLKSELLYKSVLIILTIIIITWFQLGTRYPGLADSIQAEIKKLQYEKKIAKKINVDFVVLRLNELMEEDKVYTDGDITVQTLANMLSIPNHQLSNIIKNNMHTSFNSFINEYRINEAKKKIGENPDCNILSVGFAVGFNSKSAFYEAFTRHTGITPGQFKNNK